MRKEIINNCELYLGDCRDIINQLEFDAVITDPPFNIGYHYNSYKDNLEKNDYVELLKTFNNYPSVFIHYHEQIVEISMLRNQVPNKIVSWVYPSNTAKQQRAIAWFGIKPDFTKASQPYRNPKDKRIAKRIAEGKSARLYDWWLENQVKNVSKDKTAHPCQMPLKIMDNIIKITRGG